MSYTIPMDKAGRIVIPKEVRQQLGATESCSFELDMVLDRIELKLKETSGEAPRVQKERGMWVASSGGREFDAKEAINLLREERVEQAAPESGGQP